MFFLEDKRRERIVDLVILIQKIARGWVARHKVHTLSLTLAQSMILYLGLSFFLSTIGFLLLFYVMFEFKHRKKYYFSFCMFKCAHGMTV